MKRKLAKMTGIVAVLVMVLAFFAACNNGTGPSPSPPDQPGPPGPPSPPPGGGGEAWFDGPDGPVHTAVTRPLRRVGLVDDFNHGFAASLNPTYWGAAETALAGTMGYWLSGVSLGAYLFNHADAGFTGPRLVAYTTYHPANGFGRTLHTTAGDPAPVTVPPAADGVSFSIAETNPVADTYMAWVFIVSGPDGASASMYFRIDQVGVAQRFALELPADFGNVVTGFTIFNQPEGYFDWEVAPPGGDDIPSSALFLFDVDFFAWDD